MPESGSQCYLCDIPIRYDTYDGCSHACKYCFAKKFTDISKIDKKESPASLRKFINGHRNKTCEWCDWDIPIHWGGLSDPFQPCERIHRVSLESLKIFTETKYPFVVSTKGEVLVDKEYLDLFAQCNCVVQISMICSKYDKLEEGAPTFEKRLEMLKTISPLVKRTIVRVQPYMHEVLHDVLHNLKRFKEAGAYGVIIEGIKFVSMQKGLVKVGSDITYPYKVIYDDFMKLREEAHKIGLKIYAGENRLRKFGDSLTCCGIDGLEGFVPNTYNLNHLINGTMGEPTEPMKKIGSASCFQGIKQESVFTNYVRKQSFEKFMIEYYKDHKDLVNVIMGVVKK